ncbi:MAG TPA: rhomboid family intramembrane serine protease, partial [Hyphomicrobiaceae bacterium]|nr:rhomboid family intramembrane serine protease [Hyphomicrobiaceae bacterium]
MIIITLMALAGAGFYFMTPLERTRVLQWGVAHLRRLAGAAVRVRAQHRAEVEAEGTPHPWPVVTVSLAAATFAVYAWMALAPGDMADPETLVAWGANFGPRTTNGEWWRLGTASFLHAGSLALLINLGALIAVGLVLERVVGRPALVAVYLSAGVLAGLVSVSARPLDVTLGASGAVFGLYGLLLASWMWGVIHHSAAVRLPAVATLAPVAAVFGLYHVFSGELAGAAQAASVVTGFVGGLVLARGVHLRKPPAVRIAVAVTATALVALVCAVPLRGLTDIRPHVAHLVSVERATAAAYDAQVAQFRIGRTSSAALCNLIEQKILPELQSAGAPL